MTQGKLTLKEASLFFFPLLLNVQLMSVSHSVINAGLARQSAIPVNVQPVTSAAAAS